MLDLEVNSGKFVGMDRDKLERLCEVFVNAGSTVGVNDVNPIADAASTTPNASNPDTAARAQACPFSRKAIKAKLSKAVTQCPT